MNSNTVLVCVTAQETSKNLVRAGKNIADECGAKLEVISVLPPKTENEELKIIEEIYALTKEYDGEMMLYFHDEPVYTLTAHIAKLKPVTVVTGYPGEHSNNFIDTVSMILPNQCISMINGDKVYKILPMVETA